MDLELEATARQEGRQDSKGMKYEDLSFPGLVSTLGGTARNFLQAHFPVKPEPPTIPEVRRTGVG